MWIVINNEMWNTDNLDGIVAEDDQIIFVFKDHSEAYECNEKTTIADVLVKIECALQSGQKVWQGLPNFINPRSEETIYHRFG